MSKDKILVVGHGDVLSFRADAFNSGPVTVTFSNSEVHHLRRPDGTLLGAGDIRPGQFVEFDSESHRLLSVGNRRERRKARALLNKSKGKTK